VLHGEQHEQQRVDDEALGERSRLARIDHFRHRKPADEADCVENGDEKGRVGADAV